MWAPGLCLTMRVYKKWAPYLAGGVQEEPKRNSASSQKATRMKGLFCGEHLLAEQDLQTGLAAKCLRSQLFCTFAFNTNGLRCRNGRRELDSRFESGEGIVFALPTALLS